MSKRTAKFNLGANVGQFTVDNTVPGPVEEPKPAPHSESHDSGPQTKETAKSKPAPRPRRAAKQQPADEVVRISAEIPIYDSDVVQQCTEIASRYKVPLNKVLRKPIDIAKTDLFAAIASGSTKQLSGLSLMRDASTKFRTTISMSADALATLKSVIDPDDILSDSVIVREAIAHFVRPLDR